MSPVFIQATGARSAKRGRRISGFEGRLLRSYANDQVKIGYALVGASIIILIAAAAGAMVG